MKHVMIVEDDKDMQQIYREIFRGEDAKYAIEVIGDASAALKRLKEAAFDLVILDIIMEPMSGDSFFVLAKNDAKTKNVPILVISILKQETLVSLKKIANFHFLQKPITKKTLLDKIEAMAA